MRENDTPSPWSIFWGILIVLVIIFGIDWAVTGEQFFLYKVFAPAQAQVQRDTFEHSKAYNDSMIQELDHDYMEYKKADKDGKAAIKSVVLHTYASYNDQNLPDYLKQFMTELRSQ